MVRIIPEPKAKSILGRFELNEKIEYWDFEIPSDLQIGCLKLRYLVRIKSFFLTEISSNCCQWDFGGIFLCPG